MLRCTPLANLEREDGRTGEGKVVFRDHKRGPACAGIGGQLSMTKARKTTAQPLEIPAHTGY
jgi:hypothetical protein